MICDECQALFEEVGDRVRSKEVFAKVRRNDDALVCWAVGADIHALYRVSVSEEHDRVYVGLYSSDRWLSESIEADLMHTGDHMEDLLEEELVELGSEEKLGVEHFRDEKKEYVFRSCLPLPKGVKLDSEQMIARVTLVLLAYQATFSQLGKLKDGE